MSESKGGLMQLRVSYEGREDGVTVVRVDGEGPEGLPNLDASPELRRVLARLVEEERLLLVVDLSSLPSVDRKGLGVLVDALESLQRRGGAMSLVISGAQVRANVAGAGLHWILRFHDSVPSAVARMLEDYEEESIEQRRAAVECGDRERLAREAMGAETRFAGQGGFFFEHLTETISLVTSGPELDVYNASSMREMLVDLVEQGRYFLVVDLTDVVFLDSTGVAVLTGGLRRARLHSGALAFVARSDEVFKQLRLTGLVGVFPTFPTVDRAVEFLGREVQRAHG
ncbi:anti-sigma factor antagonist [Streptomyces zaomyceticus]|uniref:anti-sigma factor antagonist n=1 Tax=Streptomyces zaomyceticus TaxID=68286 RepID=UPI0034392F09